MAAAVTFDMIVAAAHRIRGQVQQTPLIQSARLTNILGTQTLLKMENLQHTGAYKERGALNKLKCLTPAEREAGVFAASAGNHAQGLAYHAGRLGIKSTIFMPVGTPVIKVTRTKFYGADIVLTGNSYDEAYMACKEAVKERNGTLVHPFDDKLIIAGQGTIGLEIMSQAPDIDIIVAPVGGGGMISGVAIAAKEINPNIKIVGVEPAKIPSMARAVAGDTSMQPAVTTIADGINVRKVGDITTDICRTMIDEWVSVTDDEICRALLLLLEGEKTVAEGAGASSVAALLAGKIDIKGKNVCAVISGGNIDMNIISMVIERGLVDTGRRVRIAMDLPDKPGALSILMSRISDLKANVVTIQNERTKLFSFGSTRVQVTLDVSGRTHAEEVFASLRNNPLFPDMPESLESLRME